VSEYDESRAPENDPFGASLSESEESVEGGPTDLASAARLLGADEGETIGDTADSDVAELGEPASEEDAAASAEEIATAEAGAAESAEGAEGAEGLVEDEDGTRSRRCAASCARSSATGTSCTPTPATRTR